jgi:uncharacterized membrane protein
MSSKANSTKESARNCVRVFCALLFLVAGVFHFYKPHFFDIAMPAWLPEHYTLIYISGVCELAGALGLLLPGPIRTITAKCLMIFLLAVFPVNIHMALHSQEFPNLPAVSLWIRLPLQFVLIAAIYWAAAFDAKADTQPRA